MALHYHTLSKCLPDGQHGCSHHRLSLIFNVFTDDCSFLYHIGNMCDFCKSTCNNFSFTRICAVLTTMILLVCWFSVTVDTEVVMLLLGCTSQHCRILCHVVMMSLPTSTSLFSQRSLIILAGQWSVVFLTF